jgi:S-layer homology domain
LNASIDLIKTAAQPKFSTLNHPSPPTMKKKSTSRSAFLNLRVLFGLFIMLAGIFLALLSFGPATTGFAQGTTRQEMTLTLAQALNLPQPPACVPGAEMFNDVPASSPFCPYIEELVRLGITGGCGGGNFCPGDPVTRQQMAAFLVKALMAGNLKFTNLTMQNGWVGNCFSGGVPQFALGLDGTVHFRGAMCRPSGASNSPFHLPANVRPSVPVYVTASQNNGATGRLIILTGGDVLVGDDPDHANSGAVFTSLSGITYNP